MTVFVPLPGNEPLAAALATGPGARVCDLAVRQFPDGESYVRLLGTVTGERVALVCTLAGPDERFLPLAFAAGAAREAGASHVQLVAPYMAYMRQDRRFADGEAVSARHFARLLSSLFDSILTIDPHLHRIHSLGEIFATPARALHAAPLLARWIAEHVENAVVLGPDAESRQWVEDVANRAGVPYAVLDKTRRGDRDVSIQLPDLSFARDRRPVLVDDIISSGHTLLQAAAALGETGFPPPVCLAVHGLFADDAYARLSAVSADVVTTSSVLGPASRICIAPLLREALAAG